MRFALNLPKRKTSVQKDVGKWESPFIAERDRDKSAFMKQGQAVCLPQGVKIKQEIGILLLLSR